MASVTANTGNTHYWYVTHVGRSVKAVQRTGEGHLARSVTAMQKDRTRFMAHWVGTYMGCMAVMGSCGKADADEE